jgi:hypothetical protein
MDTRTPGFHASMGGRISRLRDLQLGMAVLAGLRWAIGGDRLVPRDLPPITPLCESIPWDLHVRTDINMSILGDFQFRMNTAMRIRICLDVGPPASDPAVQQ